MKDKYYKLLCYCVGGTELKDRECNLSERDYDMVAKSRRNKVIMKYGRWSMLPIFRQLLIHRNDTSDTWINNYLKYQKDGVYKGL